MSLDPSFVSCERRQAIAIDTHLTVDEVGELLSDIEFLFETWSHVRVRKG
jgi:hypothetical protein